MTTVTIGEVYHSKKFRSGSSSNGPWELMSIVDDKGKNEVTIFASNIPCGGSDGCHFKLTKIDEVKFGMRKNKNDDKWYPSVTVQAEVEVIKSDIEDFGDQSVLDELPDTDLPWM